MTNPKPELTTSTDPSSPHRGKVNWWRWFWLSTLVVSLPYAWYCFYVPSNGIAWAGTYLSAREQSTLSGKPIILFFTGKWCVPCRIMKRNVWADEQVKTLVNDAFIPLMVDVDDPDSGPVVKLYEVGSTPNTIITDSQGIVLKRKGGAIVKDEFLELIGKQNSTPPKN